MEEHKTGPWGGRLPAVGSVSSFKSMASSEGGIWGEMRGREGVNHAGVWGKSVPHPGEEQEQGPWASTMLNEGKFSFH